MNYQLPQHVAIVMDGNGRWAESRGLPRVEGHKAGVEAVKKIVQCCLEKEIPCLSLFAFSSENWRRPSDEVEFLMDLFLKALEQESNALHEQDIRLVFTGDRTNLTPNLIEKMNAAATMTVENNKLLLNIVLNYSGQWDILQASKKLAQDIALGRLTPEKVDEQYFKRNLSTKDIPDPDLFIRTSGEKRISNFFLWQLAYTELYFTEIQWPDFSAVEFEDALVSFGARERRFGQISRQLQRK